MFKLSSYEHLGEHHFMNITPLRTPLRSPFVPRLARRTATPVLAAQDVAPRCKELGFIPI